VSPAQLKLQVRPYSVLRTYHVSRRSQECEPERLGLNTHLLSQGLFSPSGWSKRRRRVNWRVPRLRIIGHLSGVCGALARFTRTQLVPFARGRGPPRPAVLHAWLARLGGAHQGFRSARLPRRQHPLSCFRRPAPWILLLVLIRQVASLGASVLLGPRE
jgi:hypothetical protein